MIALENVQLETNMSDYSEEEIKDIINHIYCLLTTIKGTIPFSRDIGMDSEIIDLPVDIAQARYTVEAIRNINDYENRVSVKEVTFSYDERTFSLNPKVVLTNAE